MINGLHFISSALSAVTPTPTPPQSLDPNRVTPGLWGFVVTFAVMAVVVILVIDMTRRIRRTNYRAEVRMLLDAEEKAANMQPNSDERANP